MFSATKDDTVRSMKSASQNLQSNISNAANEAKGDLQDAANLAGRKVRSLYNTAVDEASHVRDTVETQIRTRPVQSSLIALGIGVVLGALFRR